MREGLYYDPVRRRPLGPRDGGAWELRRQGHQAAFLVHPSGVPVFGNCANSDDEYAAGDPYGVAEGFDTAFHQRRKSVTLRWVLDGGEPLDRILDLGCGEGHLTEEVRRLEGTGLVCGLDASVSAVTEAARRYPELELSVCDAHAPPFFDDFFDLVICNNLWEHVPAPMLLLSGISRVLRPAGRLLISTPSRYRTENLVQILRGHRPRLMSEHHVTEYSLGQMREMLDWGGFDLLRAYSPRVPATGRLLPRLVISIARPIFRITLALLRSDHCLESTVFYLARKRPQTQNRLRLSSSVRTSAR